MKVGEVKSKGMVVMLKWTDWSGVEGWGRSFAGSVCTSEDRSS